jgi:carboxypeptidase Taq
MKCVVRRPLGASTVVLAMLSSLRQTSLAFVAHRPSRSTMMILRGGSTSAVADAPTEDVTANAKEVYQELLTKLETITHLERASSVLSYDQLVFMPSSAAADRGAQMSALAGVLHGMKTDSDLKELLERVLELDNQQPGDLDGDALKLIALERKDFVENERVPASLATKAAGLSSSAYGDWVAARENKDFAAFAPTLRECFDTAMETAKAKRGEDESKTLYDQMLDQFEVGMGQARIDEIFEEVQSALVPLIANVLASPSKPSSEPLKGTFDIAKQQQLSEKLVSAIGYDKEQGRIDVSVHPFSSSMSAKDVRITSRFRDDEWYQGLAGTLHEGGHAIYEQNLRPSAVSIDRALSMGTHESQSLFWERHIGLSKPFWRFAHSSLPELDGSFEKYTPEEIYGAVNRVKNSFIRVEADELTYPLHVILRYNIEKDVIGGKQEVADLSKRWNDDMKALLDVDVTSDDKGVLQDVHWSALAFGYFPTYLIGAITAAQLYHYCEKDIPDIESKIENGDFQPIKDWLKEKVHQHGRRYESLDSMLEDQLGEALNPKYYIEYLTAKYSELYKL